MIKYANNEKIYRNLRNVFPMPYIKEDGKLFLEIVGNTPNKEEFVRAIDWEGEAVGTISLLRESDIYSLCGEAGYWLGEPFWGEGIMTKALKDIVAYGFETMGLVRIWAEVFAFNKGSARVLEKVGFLKEATLKSRIFKNGVVSDSYIYAIVKEK
ncbi:hypothetical protein AZF37_04215 [endosymbiont 'TC1' of Trimyema compressum]|nr:hypothetical protein AZF37_04215 [endosymbiont 'TC1' of Trimyema compressum]